jgi:hypothetical protein
VGCLEKLLERGEEEEEEEGGKKKSSRNTQFTDQRMEAMWWGFI